jgi:PIN domain nuclease of toxin-antitoxin system
MKLLLDTHIFLWSLIEPSRLTTRVAAELDTPSNELWLSPIVVWEVLILAEKDRVTLQPDPVAWIRNVLLAIPFTEAPLSHEIAMRSRLIDLPHQDPVDRFLAATALAYDLTLVTADERLLQCKSIATLPNR